MGNPIGGKLKSTAYPGQWPRYKRVTGVNKFIFVIILRKSTGKL
jgi:hypothetical protein